MSADGVRPLASGPRPATASAGPVAAGVRPVLAGARLELATTALTPLTLAGSLLEPLGFALIAFSGRLELTVPVVLGAGFVGLWSSLTVGAVICVFSERRGRTLELLAVAPTPLALPVAGRMLAVGVYGSVALPATVLLALAVGGAPVRGSVPAVLASVAVGAAGFVALGFVLAAVLLRHRLYAGVSNGLFGAVLVATGVLAPTSLLPGWLHGASLLLAPTWAMRALRASESGQAWAVDLLVAVGLTGLTLLIGAWALRSAQARIRHDPGALLQ